jgi:hypothetical protein
VQQRPDILAAEDRAPYSKVHALNANIIGSSS